MNINTDYKTPADLEICILSAAYTVYRELTDADQPLTPSEFREKYTDYGPTFHDLVCGTSDK